MQRDFPLKKLCLAFEKNRTAKQFIYYTFFPLGFILITFCCCCFIFKLQKWHLKTTFSGAAIFMVMCPWTYVCNKPFLRLGEPVISDMPKPKWEEVSFHRDQVHVKNVLGEEPMCGDGHLRQWPGVGRDPCLTSSLRGTVMLLPGQVMNVSLFRKMLPPRNH